ncbi:hypothetical protein Mp_6g02930 [Marchantia polymorpha subsp. ruderalis]|uniref:Uncharacterized protein n=2 Tax=Marchantia polymorpha TaxID=3197 RepID=A0AAF6BMY2_MARPO|nr:hypothetical protein MARPO_0035s0079 [Marchantia polymorpha]BBN13366.1 hypothetical protein Mp_6g02930 [Marchantia polymorpha subsp. ruderalis]|eukprot:PTQ41297.1 hypothetical protein MARPO_0035s0079 [Marchantia polymorpha]
MRLIAFFYCALRNVFGERRGFLQPGPTSSRILQRSLDCALESSCFKDALHPSDCFHRCFLAHLKVVDSFTSSLHFDIAFFSCPGKYYFRIDMRNLRLRHSLTSDFSNSFQLSDHITEYPCGFTSVSWKAQLTEMKRPVKFKVQDPMQVVTEVKVSIGRNRLCALSS